MEFFSKEIQVKKRIKKDREWIFDNPNTIKNCHIRYVEQGSQSGRTEKEKYSIEIVIKGIVDINRLDRVIINGIDREVEKVEKVDYAFNEMLNNTTLYIL